MGNRVRCNVRHADLLSVVSIDLCEGLPPVLAVMREVEVLLVTVILFANVGPISVKNVLHLLAFSMFESSSSLTFKSL